MAKLIKLPSFSDQRGKLTVIEKKVPFEIKRVYYIYDVPDSTIDRGGHRHKLNWQALICIKGQCLIENHDGIKPEDFLLDSPDKCLIVEPKDFHTMKNFSSDAVLLVLASEYFDADDYIDEGYNLI